MRRELGILIALGLLCGVIWYSNDAFAHEGNVFSIVKQVSMLGILATGSAFVIVTGGIDLSVGSIVGLTGVIIAYLNVAEEGRTAHTIGFSIAVAMGVALGIGLVQGLLITRLGLQPFIVTLSGMLVIRGVSQTLAGGGTISFGAESSFTNMANLGLFMHGDVPRLPYLAIGALIVVFVSAYLLHFTVFGRYLYAIGGNRDASEYSGIPVKKVETITYIISAGLAGVAGVGWATYIGGMNHQVGMAYELQAIAACVLGGFSLRGGEGTIIGVVIATTMMKVIENGLNVFHYQFKDADGAPQIWRPNDNWHDIVIGAVILIAVCADQIFHIVQKRRRTRAAGSGAAPAQQSVPVDSAPADHAG